MNVGVHLVDAPVGGAREGAEAGTLTVTVGDPVLHLGGLGSGLKMKLVNNMLVAANLRTAAEALEVGRRLGLDSGEVRKILLAGTARSFALDRLVTKLLVDPKRAGHTIRAIEKDMHMFHEACAQHGIETGLLAELAVQTRSGAVEEFEKDP